MAEKYRDALAAGVVRTELVLPGGLLGKQRIVRISKERIHHVSRQRPDWLVFCLNHMGHVLRDPYYLGHRPKTHPRHVDFVRRAGEKQYHLLVAVKFLDDKLEAWVTTVHPMTRIALTRRLRAGTMQEVLRGP